jgi:hypothetical protein
MLCSAAGGDRTKIDPNLTDEFGPADMLRGNIDRCDRLQVHGWILDATQPERRVRLEVRLDGELVGHVVAEAYRPDLAKTGRHGDGRHGFSFNQPIHLNPFTDHIFELIRAADGTQIPGSPVHMLGAEPGQPNRKNRIGMAAKTQRTNP